MYNFMNLTVLEEYRTSSHHIGKQFFGKLLINSKCYHRAAGFFSSSVFRCAPEDFCTFFENGGKMNLVCSEHFSKIDAEALADAIYNRNIIKDKWNHRQVFSELEIKGAPSPKVLSWLVANDLLRIRIAIVEGSQGPKIYHEKIGLFFDDNNNCVAFSGSVNETWAALISNFERLEVFRSWINSREAKKAMRLKQQFDMLWKNRTDRIIILELFEAFSKNILKIRKTEKDEYLDKEQADYHINISPEIILPPYDIKLFPHQNEAINEWAKAGGRGILKMATGTGKTITALHLASKLYENLGNELVIIIIAPLIHLVDQWRAVSKEYGLDPIRCAENINKWESELSAAIHSINTGNRSILSVITTEATLKNEAFNKLIRRVRKPMILIADEAHNISTPKSISSLPDNAQYRLALTATPFHIYDIERNEDLKQYFGNIVFSYDLKEAIQDEILTPYYYYPFIVNFDDHEADEYIRLSRLIAQYDWDENSLDVSDVVKMLLIKRARLVASAKNKLIILRDFLKHKKKESHTLIYCGDGTIEGPDPDESVKQINEVVRIIGEDLGMRCSSYTYKTPPKLRTDITREFEKGFIQVLVAIRCLDEGVDIPATKNAFILASSTNPRQFIQRRGRILRKYPGKDYSYIYDFFVAPPLNDIIKGSPEYNIIRRLFISQIKRIREFSDLATNGPVARRKIIDISRDFNVLDAWEDSYG